MIVCDMCPDRTPASMRWIIESIEPEIPKTEAQVSGLMAVLGFLPKATFRTSAALCAEHSQQVASDPEIGRTLFEDALRANFEGGPS